MKDNVIRLNDDTKCYILDEMIYKNKKYVYCVEIDSNDELIKENMYVLEIIVRDDKLMTKEIEDLEIASAVTNMFLARAIEE